MLNMSKVIPNSMWIHRRQSIIWSFCLSLRSEGECDTRLVSGFKQFMLRWGTELNWQLHYSFMTVLCFLKCVQWSGLTYCAEMKCWDAPGGQRAALIFKTGKQKEASRDRSRLVCEAFVRFAATSSQKSLCTLFGFTKRQWQQRHWIRQHLMFWFFSRS